MLKVDPDNIYVTVKLPIGASRGGFRSFGITKRLLGFLRLVFLGSSVKLPSTGKEEMPHALLIAVQ